MQLIHLCYKLQHKLRLVAPVTPWRRQHLILKVSYMIYQFISNNI